MDEITQLWQWLQSNQIVLGWLALISALIAVLFFLAIPLVVLYLPRRYLIEKEEARLPQSTFLRLPYLIFKNFLGGVLVLAGLVMLLIPGQGLLTILVGLGLMSFPGKRRLIRRLVGGRRVIRTINRLRARARKPPLLTPGENSDD